MANINDPIIPNLTIYIYKDVVKDTPDYTVVQDNDKYLLSNLEVGKYWYKCVGQHNTQPIAEEYKSFIVKTNSIIDSTGVEVYANSLEQKFQFIVNLGMPELEVYLTHDGSDYEDATIEVGKNDSNNTPRVMTYEGNGRYLLTNVLGRKIQPIKIIPNPEDELLQVNTLFPFVTYSNHTIVVELLKHFYLELNLFDSTSNTLIRTDNAALLQEDRVITPLFLYNGVLRTRDKVTEGIYTLYIKGFDYNNNHYVTSKSIIDLTNINEVIVSKNVSLEIGEELLSDIDINKTDNNNNNNVS